MAQTHEFTFDTETVKTAIDLCANQWTKTTGRHPEWIKRRLRDGVREYQNDGPDKAAYASIIVPLIALCIQLEEGFEQTSDTIQ